jgi:hypothetical protein
MGSLEAADEERRAAAQSREAAQHARAQAEEWLKAGENS